MLFENHIITTAALEHRRTMVVIDRRAGAVSQPARRTLGRIGRRSVVAARPEVTAAAKPVRTAGELRPA